MFGNCGNSLEPERPTNKVYGGNTVMHFAFRTSIPVSLTLGSGLALSAMHAETAQAACTDLRALPIPVVNTKSVLRIQELLEPVVDY